MPPARIRADALCDAARAPEVRGVRDIRLARRRHALSRRRQSPAEAARRDRRTRIGSAHRRERRAVSCAGAAAAAGRRDLHPRARHHRHGRAAARSQCRAAPETARRNGAAVPPRARGDRPDAALSRSLQLLARRADEDRISGREPRRLRDAAGRAGRARRGGLPAPLSRRRASESAPRARPRARHDGQARLRAILSHRARHRQLRALQGHPVPGARLRGQFGHLLLPRHHRGGPRKGRSPVRALRLRGAQRAARHRRRFRARAARGGDPAHLRANTAATTRTSPPPSSAIAAAARSARSARRSDCPTTPSARSPACCGAGRSRA